MSPSSLFCEGGMPGYSGCAPAASAEVCANACPLNAATKTPRPKAIEAHKRDAVIKTLLDEIPRTSAVDVRESQACRQYWYQPRHYESSTIFGAGATSAMRRHLPRPKITPALVNPRAVSMQEFSAFS